MQEILIRVLTVLYTGVGVVGVVGFFPIIKDLYIHRKRKANMSTFMLWTTTSFISFNYAAFVVQDRIFSIAAAINFTTCFLILMMLLFLELEGERGINKFTKGLLKRKS